MTGSVRLSVDDLRHAYDGAPVLNGISFIVAPGEILCLLGTSGCGKTTVLRLVAGLEQVEHGRVAIDGRVVADAVI
jgi:iron(III) transport system ATP-binding protein